MQRWIQNKNNPLRDFPDRVTPSTLDTGGETNISHAATAADLFIHITLHIIAGTIKYAIEFFLQFMYCGGTCSVSLTAEVSFASKM